MSFYQANLAVLAAGNAFLLYRQYKREHKAVDSGSVTKPLTDDVDKDTDVGADIEGDIPGDNVEEVKEAVRKFQWDFFLVYALAVAADWLQVRLYLFYSSLCLPDDIFPGSHERPARL
jgi:hypothetical protein